MKKLSDLEMKPYFEGELVCPNPRKLVFPKCVFCGSLTSNDSKCWSSYCFLGVANILDKSTKELEMTKFELTKFLNIEFDKWKVEVNSSHGTIRVKIYGSFSLNSMVTLYDIVPAGVFIKFYTMGFWEAFFTKSETWREV